MIDSSAKELEVSRQTDDKRLKRQEQIMNQMRDDLYERLNMFSLEHFDIKLKT